MNPPNLATPGKPIARVLNPDTLAAIAAAVGEPVREAVRIPGMVRSSYRAWTVDGRCFEMAKSGPRAMVPVRQEPFDRTAKFAAATA